MLQSSFSTPDCEGGKPSVKDDGTNDNTGNPALEQLLPAKRGALLDIIDKLRSSLAEYKNELDIPLPRIVLCGDQSSGKSSVIEAICERPFPKGTGVCTLFPTELKLRRGPSCSIEASIKPAESRSIGEAQSLSSWRPKPDMERSFESTIKEAAEFLKKESNRPEHSLSYFEDELQIEYTHPLLPPITLVDLPGIIHANSVTTQTEQDIETVRRLVQKYLDDIDTIILPVISAEVDLQHHKILTMVKNADPHGQRTLGIITKPDTLLERTKRQAYLRCARNEEHKFHLGWQVVKNQQTRDDKTLKLKERDTEEHQFFSTGDWGDQLSRDQLGIGALRVRINKLLDGHFCSALGKTSEALKDALGNCREEQVKFGDLRSSPDQQRTFLIDISVRFQILAKQALEGPYEDDSFFEHGDEMGSKRLGAAKRNLNDDFAAVMRTWGHEREFLDDNEAKAWPEDGPKKDGLPVFENFEGTVGKPQLIHRREYVITHIEKESRQNRLEVQPGLPDQWIMSKVFREQSKRWPDIAKQHIKMVREVAEQTFVEIAHHVTTEETAMALSSHLIFPEFNRRQDEAEAMLSHVLRPYKRNRLITLDDNFMEEVANGLSRVQRHYISNNGFGNQRQSIDISLNSSFISDYALGYYKVAKQTFVENVANLVVEQCLFDDLTNMLAPTEISKMDDEMLHKLAAESEDLQNQRKSLAAREETIKKALKLCQSSTYQLSGRSTILRRTRPALTTESFGQHEIGNDQQSKTQDQASETPSQGSYQPVLQPKSRQKDKDSVTSQPSASGSTASPTAHIGSRPTNPLYSKHGPQLDGVKVKEDANPYGL